MLGAERLLTLFSPVITTQKKICCLKYISLVKTVLFSRTEPVSQQRFADVERNLTKQEIKMKKPNF